MAEAQSAKPWFYQTFEAHFFFFWGGGLGHVGLWDSLNFQQSLVAFSLGFSNGVQRDGDQDAPIAFFETRASQSWRVLKRSFTWDDFFTKRRAFLRTWEMTHQFGDSIVK